MGAVEVALLGGAEGAARTEALIDVQLLGLRKSVIRTIRLREKLEKVLHGGFELALAERDPGFDVRAEASDSELKERLGGGSADDVEASGHCVFLFSGAFLAPCEYTIRVVSHVVKGLA